MKASMFLRCSALALCLVSAPAMAQQTDDAFSQVLRMIGIGGGEKEQIEYRERAPLVVPPSTGKLRAPEDPASQRAANWPQDPDVLARKRREEEAKLPVARDRRTDPNQDAQVTLEQGQTRNRYAGVPTQGVNTQSPGARELIPNLTPEQVRAALAGREKSEPLTPGAEPKRQFLTEPPTGYRRAAAGAPVKASTEPLFRSEAVEMDIMRPRNR